jgi:hypothetical protein
MAAAAMMIRVDDEPLEPVAWMNLADQAPEAAVADEKKGDFRLLGVDEMVDFGPEQASMTEKTLAELAEWQHKAGHDWMDAAPAHVTARAREIKRRRIAEADRDAKGWKRSMLASILAEQGLGNLADAVMAVPLEDISLDYQDELHPTGRCTCGGEGRCEWCHRICEVCMGDCYETSCGACGSAGYRPEPDYEALGYPETEAYETELESAANVARYFCLTVDLLAFEHWSR